MFKFTPERLSWNDYEETTAENYIEHYEQDTLFIRIGSYAPHYFVKIGAIGTKEQMKIKLEKLYISLRDNLTELFQSPNLSVEKARQEIEKQINELAEKARSFRLSMQEMSGGTFTITNGGVFGSMLSTPLLNPPQAAILGMHNIVERPVAVKGKVEIRPVMYLALSYDHRLIDGKDSVSFLYKIKELIESPVNMLFYGKNPDTELLNL